MACRLSVNHALTPPMPVSVQAKDYIQFRESCLFGPEGISSSLHILGLHPHKGMDVLAHLGYSQGHQTNLTRIRRKRNFKHTHPAVQGLRTPRAHIRQQQVFLAASIDLPFGISHDADEIDASGPRQLDQSASAPIEECACSISSSPACFIAGA